MSVRSRWSMIVIAVWLLALVAGVAAGQNMTGQTQVSSRAGGDAKYNLRIKKDQWFLRGRTLADGSAAASRYRVHQQKMEVRTARLAAVQGAVVSLPRDSAVAGWTPLGPAPLASDASGEGAQDYGWVSGRATAVAIDRNDTSGNTVYIGGAYGGVWKSTTAGPLSPNPAAVVWTPLTDNQATLSVGAIAVQPQPSNPDSTKSVVLVGTGETNGATDSYYGLGILRSADAGSSWTLVTTDSTGKHPFAGIGFSQIAFSTSNIRLVVAGAAGTSQGEVEGLQNPLTANLGLYSSSDAGVTWNATTIMDGPFTVLPGSVTSVVYNAVAGEFFAAIRFHGFYASTDGLLWTRLTNQPGAALAPAACPATPVLPSCPIYRGQLAVVDGRNEMFAWYVDADNTDQGIWRSIDGGLNWTPIDDSSITNCGDLIGGCGTENGSYNLTLAAAPNGSTGTDIYAGATNLFKCSISNTFPTCSPNVLPAPPPQATFLNLTHVYGCPPDLGSIAKVHPSQHAMDTFPITNGTQLAMYFANDGGIYRTLDGYSDLNSGTCGAPNQFDSLNQTLGSLTQFVSLAQHPTDANTVLGGTQGNGTPATAAALSSSRWSNVNSADGGYTEINPDDPAEWFTANTGVSIQRCSLGMSCHAQDFNADLVVSNATVGGDEGALYTPYMLDPQNSSQLIVGTCRIWRGLTTGAGFNPLSNNFETGGSEACTGDEVNVVRALAAGGSKDVNGLSSVIYAGTDGLGPLAAVSTSGGHVWVTTNPAGGPASWIDRTGGINPQHFPVSGIAIDHSDPTGRTAFVTIMGFNVPHVWQTSNGGQSWTDFTANLPHAPTNAVVTDPGTTAATETVYVATDVGVFSSNAATPSWAEVGPLASSGQTGFLPNVAVMALRLFNDGSTKLLRAATYGRGAWQFPLTTVPDFQIALPTPSQTVFAGQTTTFHVILNEFNGYANAVTLTCAAGDTAPPSTCTPIPSSAIPAAGGSDFSLTAGGSVGDYSFLLAGTGPGADPNGSPMEHSVPLALHVVDFTLSTPSPSAIVLLAGQTVSPITLQVNFLGSFPASGTINLACTAPTGIACGFLPNASVGALQGATATVTMTVGATSSAATGSITLNITATSSAAGSKTQTQPLGVTVVASAYSLAVNPNANIVAAGQLSSVNGIATTNNGYGRAVSLTCTAGTSGGLPPSSCSMNPSTVTPTAGGTPFQIAVSNGAAGSFSFNAHGRGADGIVVDTPVALTVYDFAISASTGAPVKAGQTATYTLTFTPEPSGTTFQGAVNNFGCTGLPTLSNCVFGSSQIAAGSGASNVTLMISTTGPVASLHPRLRYRVPVNLLFATLWPIGGIAFITLGIGPMAKNSSKNHRKLWLLCTVFVALTTIIQVGCSGGLVGGGSAQPAPLPGPIPNTYSVTVSASEGPLTRPTVVALTVQ